MGVTFKTKNLFGPVLQEIVADMQGKHYRRLKNALWIYLYLVIYANPKNGKLTSTVTKIAISTGHQEETINSWLGNLKKWHYISIEKHGEELQFKVSQWKKMFAAFEDIHTVTNEKSGKGRKPSNKKILPKEPKELAKYIAEDLDVISNLSYLEKLCQEYPRDIALKAYKRLKEVPVEKVKTKIGLFVYLIKKYAKEK